MTAWYQFESTIKDLNAAEAFSAASRIEKITSQISSINISSVPFGDVKELPSLLLNFATSSNQDLDALPVDGQKVQNAIDLVSRCTVREACEFTYMLKEQPEYAI